MKHFTVDRMKSHRFDLILKHRTLRNLHVRLDLSFSGNRKTVYSGFKPRSFMHFDVKINASLRHGGGIAIA